MPNYLFEGKLLVNNRQIFCKVTGEPGTENDGRPWVIMLAGGPGFSHKYLIPDVEAQLKAAAEKGLPPCHYILFDHLGCGESDKPHDVASECTVDNYTEIAGKLVEESRVTSPQPASYKPI